LTEQKSGPRDDGPPKRAFVIARRRKGRPVTDAVREVEQLLEAEGATVESEIVRRKKDVRESTSRAMKAGFDVIVAVGGDGMVLEVATALAGSQVPLAIVPTGTGNLLAGNLDIPHPPAEAVHTAIAGRRRRIDLGQVKIDGKRRDFTVACGVGFDADVMDRTDSEQKGRWGKFAYLANAILETGNIRNVAHRVTIDGVQSTTEAAQVLIANFGRVAGQKVRGVRADDGLLDVFIVKASGPLPGLLAGWQAIRTTEAGETGGGRVYRAQARKVRIETTPKRLVETDGSIVGKTPITVSVRPSALTVMVPRREAR
jgi:diacylglycerol kinase (ATP)